MVSPPVPVAVLRFEQSFDDAPQHHISRTLAQKLLAYRHFGKRAAVRLQPQLVKIAIPVAFGTLKALVRAAEREEQASSERFRPYLGPMPPVELECLHFRPPADFKQQMPHFVSVRWQ